MSDVVLFGGGIIPDDDIPKLVKKGVDRVFTPGTPIQGDRRLRERTDPAAEMRRQDRREGNGIPSDRGDRT